MVAFVVQARCTGLGWVDSKTAETYTEAIQKQKDLIADDDAWMSAHKSPHNHPKQTRIVPVTESNCADRYLRPERY